MSRKPPSRARRKLLGIAKVIDSRERDKGIPAPWAYRWSWRIFVFAVMIYSYYVVVGRLCAPMLQRRSNARGSVGEGAGLLVGETLLFLMFMWTYIKAIFTSPGIAPKLVPQAPPPGQIFESGGQVLNTAAGEDHDGNGVAPGPLDAGRNLWPAEVPLPGFLQDSAAVNGDVAEGVGDRSEAPENGHPSSASVEYANAWKQRNSGYGSDMARTGSNPFDARDDVHQVESRESGIPLASTAREVNGAYGGVGYSQDDASDTSRFTANGGTPTRPFPPAQHERAYCQYCRIYKPWRSHHCRVCGKCVLGMDHDCPWVNCIGWRNHKFFINFLTWSSIYTIYVLVVLACELAQGGSSDGQMIGITAAAGFFTFFTTSMLLSHIQLISIGMTTIESFSLRSQLDKERAMLSTQFGTCAWGRKRRTMKTWTREWGDLKTEGNRWYAGPGPLDEWKRVMGDNPLWWILPIGRSEGDGIEFEQNVRFAADGNRRRRSDWPSHLQ